MGDRTRSELAEDLMAAQRDLVAYRFRYAKRKVSKEKEELLGAMRHTERLIIELLRKLNRVD